MTDALAYLLWTSLRNRAASQLRRVRNPRYAAALVVGLLYFWWFLFRPTRPGVGGVGGVGSAGGLLGPTSEALAPLIIVLVLSSVWLFGGDRSALAFTQAEVSLLLTAPVPRRTLIAYKLVRAQLAILISSVIWVLLLRRGNASLPAAVSALGFWVLFMTLSCHRLGAALVRASSQEHRAAGVRRHWLPIALFGAVAVVLLGQLVAARASLSSASDAGEIVRALAQALSAQPARAVLYPFHLMLAPSFAGNAGDWARAMPAALGILALHAWWVLGSDAAFEEAAAEASALRAAQVEKLRARRGAVPIAKASSGKRTIALASTGRPADAIVWKNLICLMRTSQLRTLLAPVMVAFVAGIALAGRIGDVAQNIALVASLLAVMLLLFGGRALRNDLRSDMLHLPMLKSLPLSGTEMVLAQVASGAVPMAAAQFVLVAIAEAALAASHGTFQLSVELRLALLVAAPVALLALNVAMFTILNGTAVLFPGWLRLGPAGPAGVEAMGSNVIATFGTMLVLLLLLVLPAAAGGAILALLSAHIAVASALAGIVGSLVLAAESYGLILGMGRAFDRAEPSQVT
jgi:ABC-2 type transport system permease protein